MLQPDILPFAEPVEERIELVGELATGDRVPPDHFALIPYKIKASPETITRYVRSGARVDAPSLLYRVARVRR